MDQAGRLIEQIDQVTWAMRGVGEMLRARIRSLVLKRLDLVREFQRLRGGRNADVLQLLCESWASTDSHVNARWPDEAQPASRSQLYHFAARLNNGDVRCLFGRIQPRPSARGSRVLDKDGEAHLRKCLATQIFTLPATTPTTVLHQLVRFEAQRSGLPVPSEKWTRRVASDIQRDQIMATVSHRGAKGMLLGGPYIQVDKTSILPGSHYVMDNRQFDAEVICLDGKVRRPWITSIVDQRTLLPVGWSILESPANGDSVMATIAAAMLPKKLNDYNAVAGDVLGILCGVPDVWQVDNGKDFTNRRIVGFSPDQVRALIGETHRALGDDRSDNQIVLGGLLTETEARVRRSIPYNAKAKIVERTFRDTSRSFDVLVPGYVGSKPEERPARTEEMRHKYAKLLRANCTRAEIAAATGYLLIEQFADRYEAWQWQWASREDSRAQGLQYDGRAWSPLALWGKLAPSRRIPTPAMLERLAMIPTTRVVDRGTIRLRNRVYTADELLPFGGREVVVRWSPLNATYVLVEQIVGEAPLPRPIRVGEVQYCPANASVEELEAFMGRLGDARRGERARIKELTSAVVADPLIEIAANVARQGREAQRGQIVSINGQKVTPIISVRDEPVNAEPVLATGTMDIYGQQRQAPRYVSFVSQRRSLNHGDDE